MNQLFYNIANWNLRRKDQNLVKTGKNPCVKESYAITVLNKIVDARSR